MGAIRGKRLFSATTLVAACLAAAMPAVAKPLGVVELFTSQGCNSCPPADAALGRFVQQGNLVVLAYHVDYWDYLGWKDTLGSRANTERQYAYAKAFGSSQVYTPQAVINGSVHVIGSDLAGIENAIGTTSKEAGVMSVPVTMTQSGKQITVSVAAAKKPPLALHGEVWICSISKAILISIARGENRGKELTYYNVVRNLVKVGDWNGNPGSWSVPLDSVEHEGVDAAVAYVQDGSRDRPGPMLGAAYTLLH